MKIRKVSADEFHEIEIDLNGGWEVQEGHDKFCYEMWKRGITYEMAKRFVRVVEKNRKEKAKKFNSSLKDAEEAKRRIYGKAR